MTTGLRKYMVPGTNDSITSIEVQTEVHLKYNKQDN